MALGQIPWSETLKYAQHYHLDEDDTESLIELVERVKPRKIYTLHGPDSFAGELCRRGWDATPARHARQLTLL